MKQIERESTIDQTKTKTEGGGVEIDDGELEVGDGGSMLQVDSSALQARARRATCLRSTAVCFGLGTRQRCAQRPGSRQRCPLRLETW
jgi:hypothetical protein